MTGLAEDGRALLDDARILQQLRVHAQRRRQLLLLLRQRRHVLDRPEARAFGSVGVDCGAEQLPGLDAAGGCGAVAPRAVARPVGLGGARAFGDAAALAAALGLAALPAQQQRRLKDRVLPAATGKGSAAGLLAKD